MVETKKESDYSEKIDNKRKIFLTKAELLQLNRTQFPSLGIFVSKKVGNQKNQDHFYYISFNSCTLGGLSFIDFQFFY